MYVICSRIGLLDSVLICDKQLTLRLRGGNRTRKGLDTGWQGLWDYHNHARAVSTAVNFTNNRAKINKSSVYTRATVRYFESIAIYSIAIGVRAWKTELAEASHSYHFRLLSP